MAKDMKNGNSRATQARNCCLLQEHRPVRRHTPLPPNYVENLNKCRDWVIQAWRSVKKSKRGACQQKAATVLPDRTAAA